MKKIAMIPVRAGSTRLERKNYLSIAETKIFERSIQIAVEANCFDHIVLNTEDKTLKNSLIYESVKFYHRSDFLASSEATSDKVVSDFLKYCDKITGGDEYALFWINTASPLTLVSDVQLCVSTLLESTANSLISIRQTRGHLMHNGVPINFSDKSGFAKTQNIIPGEEFTYAIMAWKASAKEKIESGILFDEHTLRVPLSFWSSLLLKNLDDYQLIMLLADVHPELSKS